ncbi:MAG: tetratricopeptide repeat protein, partial [Nitrospinae bacterium]|nr:tetratricopeptide repeat protein [Nitrospinota bacterium]
ENVSAWYNLAMTYRSSGMYQEAKKVLEKALELAPGDKRLLSAYYKLPRF